MNEISALLRIDLGKQIVLSHFRGLFFFFSLSTISGPSKKITIREPESGLSPDIRCAGTLILDFSRNKFLLFTIHPVYGILLQQLELRQSHFKFFFLCFLSFHVKWCNLSAHVSFQPGHLNFTLKMKKYHLQYTAWGSQLSGLSLFLQIKSKLLTYHLLSQWKMNVKKYIYIFRTIKHLQVFAGVWGNLII